MLYQAQRLPSGDLLMPRALWAFLHDGHLSDIQSPGLTPRSSGHAQPREGADDGNRQTGSEHVQLTICTDVHTLCV